MVTISPAAANTQPIRFGRRAKPDEVRQIRQLTQDLFGENAKRVNPNFTYIGKSKIPGLTQLAGILVAIPRGVKHVLDVYHNGSTTYHELATYRTEKMLDASVERLLKKADEYSVDEKRDVYTLRFKNGQAEAHLAKLAARNVLIQLTLTPSR